MDYPNDKEVLESFTCVHPLSVSYHTAHISRAMRALSSSSKTSLRIEEGGLLSLQFILPGAAPGSGPVGKKDKNAFIEFRVSYMKTLINFTKGAIACASVSGARF